MHIFTFRYPGTWLTRNGHPAAGEVPSEELAEWKANVENYIFMLQHELDAASAALNLFESSIIHHLPTKAMPRMRSEEDAHESRIIFENLAAEHGIPSTAAMFDIDAHHHIAIERIKSAKELPDQQLRKLPFLYAESFLFTLHRLERYLVAFSKLSSVPDQVRNAPAYIRKSIPHVKDLRDSMAHIDERIQGLAVGKPIQVKPVDVLGFVKSSGGVVVTAGLNKNRFGSLIANGEYVEIEISVGTLTIIADLIQDLINAFEWRGYPRYSPI